MKTENKTYKRAIRRSYKNKNRKDNFKDSDNFPKKIKYKNKIKYKKNIFMEEE